MESNCVRIQTGMCIRMRSVSEEETGGQKRLKMLLRRRELMGIMIMELQRIVGLR